jgi:hypothetical protein
MQETLDYLVFFQEQDEKHVDNFKEYQMDVYVAALETLIAILRATDYLQQAFFAKGGWPLLLTLLRRHDHRLRNFVCELLTLCFLRHGNLILALGDSDFYWSQRVSHWIMQDDCRAVIFNDDFKRWGHEATNWTIELLHLLCVTQNTR